MTDSTSPIHARHHAVQFYGNDQSLFTTVAGFLSEGLVNGQPAIVIATKDHRVAIANELAKRLIDVEQAQRIGELVLLDAHDTLATFMMGDEPDPNLFDTNVGSLIEQALTDRPRTIVRAYGEMVDVLWQEQRMEAAIQLEMLWNKLALSHGFALLCGYSMGNFYKQAERLQAVCDQHTHVLEAEPNVAVFDQKHKARTA